MSFSRTGAGLCIYHLLAWSNLNFFHISQWITLPIQSCLVLYSFCANLLHSLIMWLIVSSLSPDICRCLPPDTTFHLCHRIVYICYFVASYLSSPWYDFLMALLLLLLINKHVWFKKWLQWNVENVKLWS